MQGSFASCSTRTRLVWTTCCSNCAISMGIGPWTMLPWRETCITVAKTLCEMAGRACALRVFLFVLPAAASQGTRSVSGVNCLATATRSVSGVNCLCIRCKLTVYCIRCKLSSYCSRTCQKAHWKAHKKVCKQAPEQAHGTDAASADVANDACAADGGARAAATLAENYSSSLASSRRAQKRAELERLLISSSPRSLT